MGPLAQPSGYGRSSIGSDQSEKGFRRSGNTWTFVRGKFFDDPLGFVLTADPAGTITGVRFGLKVRPKPAT